MLTYYYGSLNTLCREMKNICVCFSRNTDYIFRPVMEVGNDSSVVTMWLKSCKIQTSTETSTSLPYFAYLNTIQYNFHL